MGAAQRFRAGATLAFFAIAIATWLYWPLPELGIATDPRTGKLITVAAGSVAAQAGLQVGDQITRIYDYPWSAINSRLLLVPLPWRDGTPTPVQLRRGDTSLSLTLYADQPGPALQLDKALRTMAALACWLTGALLGLSPQAANPHLRWTAWFWVLLGGALGALELVQIVSYVLSVPVLWLLGSIMAPTAAMLHLWYPSRPMANGTLRLAQGWWLLAIGLLQGAFLGLTLLAETTTDALERLETATMLSFLASFVLSAGILWRAYRSTTIAHIRRQIRLIAVACIIVACTWTMYLLGEVLAPQLILSIPGVILTAVAAIIPLAYLYGGISPDLLRADHIARHVAAHALTAVSILALLAVATLLGLPRPAPLLIAVIVVAAYGPTYRLLRRLGAFPGERTYDGLSQAVAQLGSSLDADRLAEIMSDGLRTAFGDPPLAVYVVREHESERVERAVARRLALPPTAARGLLGQVFADQAALLSIGEVQRRVTDQELNSSSAALVFAPLVSLWGLIRQPEGPPLGLVILGPRGDLDPYRERDLDELARLLAAAGLAFTNSASYARQVEAQQVIRRLYRHLQQAQEVTAAAIAREIHDEVLNVNVRLNVAALERLLLSVERSDAQLYDELFALLESEQTTGEMLRIICEQLRPAYTDDPLGLPASLRRMAERLGATWEGQVRVATEGAPVPVGRQMHRELVLIAREAVTNAIKHAAATEILVGLRFPAAAGGALTLTIRDNGATQRQVAPKPKHLGLHFMRESADAIGATIAWVAREAGGTEVRVVAPLAGRWNDSLVGEPAPWGNTAPMKLADDSLTAAIGPDAAGSGGASEARFR